MKNNIGFVISATASRDCRMSDLEVLVFELKNVRQTLLRRFHPMQFVPFALMFCAAGLIQAAANDVDPLPLGTPAATASASEQQSPPADSTASSPW